MISTDVINNLLDTAHTVSYIPSDTIRIGCLIGLLIGLFVLIYFLFRDEM